MGDRRWLLKYRGLFTGIIGLLYLSACGNIDNKISGFQAKSPDKNASSSGAWSGVQWVGLSHDFHRHRTGGGYKVQGTLGLSSSGHSRRTLSGNYSVTLSVEGNIQTFDSQ